MKEFGSDFHLINDFSSYNFQLEKTQKLQYYADGRQALFNLLIHNSWLRIWMPEYFCYDVIKSIIKTGIEVLFYSDFPTQNDLSIISGLSFKEKDVLLRINYFGLRDTRSNIGIPVDVIEDHSHDLSSAWCLQSDADYCIASIRKTLPLPEGGILWSPKGNKLPKNPLSTEENENLVYKRLSAMLLKKMYLNGKFNNKNYFRNLYIKTEEMFVDLPISAMSSINLALLNTIDVAKWDKIKKNNWTFLTQSLKDLCNFLLPEKIETTTPFSLVLVFNNESERDRLKEKLIEKSIFPAVLWELPVSCNKKLNIFLSIHCDGRYNLDDMKDLVKIINRVLKK
ncbi:MAG: hypothetical protein WC140_04785 [Bacteroidales bacterium]